jgi:uncharacterized short protein YbdD (DUF466 family)
MRRYWGKFATAVRAAIREGGGAAEYERYVHRCLQRHEPPVDRGRFFNQRLEDRYGKLTRCC